jgi:hypothetical protein
MEDDYEDCFPCEDEEEDTSDTPWGTYAIMHPDIENSDGVNYRIAFFTSVIYNASLIYQKEIAIGMGAWTKKPMWDAQESYVDALHNFWTSGMDDYLASIRKEKEENEERRGIPPVDRCHMRR